MTMTQLTPAPVTPKAPAIGDILVSSWGYDQTRCSFYQVVGVTKASVKLRPIRKTCVEGGYNMPTYAKVMPVKDAFTSDDKPFIKRVKPSWDGAKYGVSIESYEWASLWDGTPQTESGDH